MPAETSAATETEAQSSQEPDEEAVVISEKKPKSVGIKKPSLAISLDEEEEKDSEDS